MTLVTLAVALVALVLAIVWILTRSYGSVAIMVPIFALAGGIAGVMRDRTGGQNGRPRFINAIVLTNARRQPPDSWIHFFRDAPTRLYISWAFVGVGAVSVGLLAWASVVAVADRQWGWVLLYAPIALIFSVFILAGGMSLDSRYRLAAWGRRANGISLGRAGVSVYIADSIKNWTWEQIRGVDAKADVFDAGTGDYSATITLDVGEQEPYVIFADDVETHAWVEYCALRFYDQHPELRGELSGSFAQARMENWAAWIDDERAREAAARKAERSGTGNRSTDPSQ